jgi:hypothetical protein
MLNIIVEITNLPLKYHPYDVSLWEKLGMSLEHTDKPRAKNAYRRALKLAQATGYRTEDVERINQRLRKVESTP